MAGGNWSTTDMPSLPGFYMNFVAAALSAIEPGARGTVILPVKAHWGPDKEFVEVGSESALLDLYTADETANATAYTTIRLALLAQPKRVLAYRMVDSAAAVASKTLQDTASTPANVLQIDATYKGARGNAFNLSIAANLLDASKKDIKLYEGSTLLRTFTFASGTVAAAVDAINSDAGNVWITATKLADGNGTLANVTNSALAGGNSGISGLANTDYIAALSAFETQDFHVLALDGVTDAALRTSVISWIKRVRSEGKGVMAALGGSSAEDTGATAVSTALARSASIDFEGIINVGVGGVLDGVSYNSAQISAWVAGLVAGSALNGSTTYAASPFEDVTRRWTRSEQEAAVKGGVFLLIHDGRKVKVLRGINSLITLREGQNRGWKKIRKIRVLDQINADLQQTAEDNYIGKVNNTEEGRLALIGAGKEYLRSLATEGVIEATGFDVTLDPRYYGSAPALTPDDDQVFLTWTADDTDVMEQIFGTFTVQ
ncbi:phage tail sheath subtilisin-like domain-containing protein [Paenibacillus sp. HN-1]|uniref:phage tail sheath subtilisin-like domain-containing protein n=1 Tax=Paenibacillus TaxID=44249 RepID=UPI001CA9F04E|nr:MULTISPECIES: phage tail sheath subtilisin-like domain-containing protein [Paenibacillus]MBY9080996.1 phage tail sheath subtilisin-like domain-containing protein [Paenibacillus sp. CGMCC 1.18879]MBY9084098.1 phage tail sheath subtilisin-like domain-containing protein [Paenibacillus sinensis]